MLVKHQQVLHLSPTPINFTVSLNWFIASTTPPFAVPSSFVIAKAVTSVAAVKCFACSSAFWPGTSIQHQQYFMRCIRYGFLYYRLILLSSSIRWALLCNRPVVSISTTSLPFAMLWPCQMPQLPGHCPWIVLQWAHPPFTPDGELVSSCCPKSIGCTQQHFLTWFLKLYASLPMVVVAQPHWLPTTNIT